MKRRPYFIFHIILALLLTTALLKASTLTPMKRLTASQTHLVHTDSWETELFDEPTSTCGQYRYQIPDTLDGELLLGIRDYISFLSVSLDEKEIYSYEDTYWEKGVGWRTVELPADCAGKTITLVLRNPQTFYHAHPPFVGNVLLGEKNAVFLQILSENISSLILGSLSILTGIIVWAIAWTMAKKIDSSERKGFTNLGIFIMLAGLWLITDSCILQFCTTRTALVYLISFCAFMLMPYFLLKFVEKMTFCKNRTIPLLAGLHLCNMAICLLLYLFHIVPIHRTLFSAHLLIVLSILVIFKQAIWEARRYQNRELKLISIGLVLLILCGGTAFFFFYRQDPIYSLFYGVGIVLFIFCLLLAALEHLRSYMIASATAREYKKLAHLDMMTHLGNRTAFLKQQEIGSWEENKSCIVFDINDLKYINDKYGHQAGDQLIIDAAECIQGAFSTLGKCYRIGGDEFVVLLPITSEQEILDGLFRLRQRIAMKNLQRTLPVKIAYGYSIRKNDTVTFQDLFHEADANMYTKKQEMKEAEKLKSNK